MLKKRKQTNLGNQNKKVVRVFVPVELMLLSSVLSFSAFFLRMIFGAQVTRLGELNEPWHASL